jgi:hypothetical protein
LEVDTDPYVAEVHAGDWWRSLGRQEREAWMKDEARHHRGGRDSGRGGKRGAKNASPTKVKEDDDSTVVRKKPSLYQPAPQLQPDLPIDDPSMVATPAEGSDGELEGETPSDGDEQPADGHGVYLPKRPTPRNGDPPQNRFAVERHFDFEDAEIGIREHHLKRNNKNELSYSGMDPTPNPKKFHFDQVARGLNSAKNKTEDLDEDLVAEFKVHPQYGLAIKDSVNPDWSDDSSFEPTDWSQPLAESESYVFIEDGPHNAYDYDHDKPAWHNSRSNWMLKTNRSFQENTTKDKIAKALEAMDDREKAGIKPKRRQINSNLLEAVEIEVSKAKEPQQRRSNQQERGKASKPRSVWPPQAGPATPQRSLPYDPTKDTGNGNTGYQTPYRQMGQPREEINALDILASEAQKRQPSQSQAYAQPRMVYSPPPRTRMREEDETFNGANRRPALYAGRVERNRSQSHQMSNSNFEPKQYEYSPQPSARRRLSPQTYSPQARPAPVPPHLRRFQSPSRATQQTTYQSLYQLPPQPPQPSHQTQPQLSPQLAQQPPPPLPPPPPQFSPPRAPQPPPAGGLRTLAPAPPQGRGSQPPQPQNPAWYGYPPRG